MLTMKVEEHPNGTWVSFVHDSTTGYKEHTAWSGPEPAVHHCLNLAPRLGYNNVLRRDVKVAALPDKTHRLVQEKIEQAIEKEMSVKESWMARYLAATGDDPRDLTLCQQTDGGVIRWWLEKKANLHMTFERFSQINRERCEAEDGFNHKLDSWSLSDWFTALAGEVGEAGNVIKKLNRIRDQIPGNGDKTEADLKLALASELADTFIYLDLLAQRAGVNLRDAVITKFDEKSAEIGYPVRIGKS